MMRRYLLTLPVILGLSACAGSDAVSTALPPGYLSAAREIVAAADWSNPETVTVTLANYRFSPGEFDLHRDRPTRLVLVNPTATDHAMVAEQFFREVAVRQLVGPTGTTPAPWISKVVIPAGQTREIWLVPARYGAFRFKCDVTGHSAFGMNGLINVIP
ncbi:MAG: hypothetical protein Q7R40_05130 [Phaeospirillum sp.]|nr:hypothetical protein [Phaeospirillum sp.]